MIIYKCLINLIFVLQLISWLPPLAIFLSRIAELLPSSSPFLLIWLPSLLLLPLLFFTLLLFQLLLSSPSLAILRGSLLPKLLGKALSF